MTNELKLFNIKSENGSIVAKGLYIDRECQETNPLLELMRENVQ